MNLVLVPIQGGRPITLDKAIIFFGRGSECDIVLTDSRKVSRKHCCVAQIDDRIVIRDLGSMNGLRVNEQEVKAESMLSIGDILWVGDLGFRLESAATAGKRVPSRDSNSPDTRPPSPAASKPTAPPNPRYLSQDVPVAIPEDDDQVDFTELSAGIIPSDEIIELDDGDLDNGP